VSDRGSQPGASAAELRAAFDAAFARPAEAPVRDAVALLALRAGGEPVALRVLETAGILAARPIVPVPSPRPELLGIAGIRGAVVPIYSLARLLGRADDGAPRWIVLAAAGAERIGLAVAAFERHVVVPAAQLRPAARGGGAEGHAPELLQEEGGATPVLSVPSLVRAITRR
jgi:purine-binding chemotaxis protein CheW